MCPLQIAQMKAHISELNLHAETQAKEYKQKASHLYQLCLSRSFFHKLFIIDDYEIDHNFKAVQSIRSYG